MPAIFVLEKHPWFVSGLRRSFPDFCQEILFRDNARDFLKLSNDAPNAFVVVDLDSLPEEGIATISAMTASEKNKQVILLVNRAQKGIIWEVMQVGCLCYLEKPVSIRILEQLCSRVFARSNTKASRPRSAHASAQSTLITPHQ